MKILVFSDSHGSTGSMTALVRREKPDVLCHLGDYCRDGEELRRKFPALRVLHVAGNCDLFSGGCGAPEQISANLEGLDLLLTHGHRQGVKMGLLRLRLTAQEAGARLALFGHTHVPYLEKTGELVLMNPGSCGSERGSYGRIQIEKEKIRCQVISLAGSFVWEEEL